MRLLHRSDEEPAPPEAAQVEQPAGERRLFGKLVILLAIAAYAVAFGLENRKQVNLHFVFVTARVSLIWLILLILALGLLGGVLLPQLYRRRRRRH
jgi:uncharacterized membrane protein YciS (DUF1049 family)